jgi:hypothetical protein
MKLEEMAELPSRPELEPRALWEILSRNWVLT